MIPSGDGPRDHLFISYASEDGALAKWLALRLTAEGYKVWIDCFELLGGEAFPENIDWAIKERTFRLLGLLSRHSIHKDDPSGERTMAINLGRERDENFLIPINVDGLTPTGLDWRTSRLTFVPFFEGWADGFSQLLEKLEEIGAPKGAANGREIAASAYLPEEVLSDDPEPLYANLLQFERIPDAISCYTAEPDLTRTVRNVLADEWAFWALPPEPGGERSKTLYFSFQPPPDQSRIGPVSWTRRVIAAWRDVREINGIWSRSIIKPLLRRALLHHLRQKGLVPTPQDSTVLYFPPGLVSGDRIQFKMPDGRTTYRKVAGERSWRGRERFRYHQAVTFDVETDLEPAFVARFRIRLHITDRDGEPLKAMAANARRKSMTRSWYNEEWLARHLALASFIAGEGDRIQLGHDDPLIVSTSLLQVEGPASINEEVIPKGTPHRPTTEEDENDTEAAEAGEAMALGESVLILEEPQLEFRYGQRLQDPRNGLALFGPFDGDRPSRPGNVPYGIIGTRKGIAAFQRFAARLTSSIVPDAEAHHHRIWRPYPGFDAAFGANWPTEGAWTHELHAQDLIYASRRGDEHGRAYEATNLYLEGLAAAAQRDEELGLVFCVIPDEVHQHCRPKSTVSPDVRTAPQPSVRERKHRMAGQARLFDSFDPVQYQYSVDFRRQLKARAMAYGLPLQLVRESTLRLPGDESDEGPRRSLTPLSDRAWNITTTAYYKAGGKPWRLASARDGVCYIGLAFRRTETKTDERSACCAAQMFLDTGDGEVAPPSWTPPE